MWWGLRNVRHSCHSSTHNEVRECPRTCFYLRLEHVLDCVCRRNILKSASGVFRQSTEMNAEICAMEAINLPKSVLLECSGWVLLGSVRLCRRVTIILEIAHLLSTDFAIQYSVCVGITKQQENFIDTAGESFNTPPPIYFNWNRNLSLGEFFISGTYQHSSRSAETMSYGIEINKRTGKGRLWRKRRRRRIMGDRVWQQKVLFNALHELFIKSCRQPPSIR